MKQRLIDANALLQYMSDMEVQTGKKCCTQAVKSCIEEFFPQVVFDQPTIDPETLPVVRELREKLERVTMERDAAVADCFKFIDSKGVVNALEKTKKGEVHTRAIWFLEWEDWIGLLRRK